MMTFVLALMLVAGPEDPQGTQSRLEEAQAAREEKAQNLKKPQRNFLERPLYEVQDRRIIERFQEGVYGFRPLIGGLESGSGFSAGTSFEHGPVRVSAQGSLRGYQKYEVQFEVPEVLSERFFADFRATRRNYPQKRFYGIGEKSNVQDRSSYRLEDTNYAARFGFALGKHVRAGSEVGWLDPMVGRGTDPRFPSIEEIFDSGHTPALGDEPQYLQAGAFLEIDYRDKPGNPRSGGYYFTSWTAFRDRKPGRYSFGRYELDVRQYLPFLNARRVIALRARATLTHTAPGQEIPFFMQPALGGADDLRGFHDERFRDRNVLVMNAEYRWEAFSGLDLALFADAGQVAAQASDIRLARLRTSYGAGFRFNTAKGVFLRMDAGFSNEGRRIVLKFNHTF